MGMDSAHGLLVDTTIEKFKGLATSGKLKKLMKDAAKALGSVEKLAIKSASDQMDNFQRSIDAASVVFCHSTLDTVMLDYCRVTATAAPERWEAFIEQRQAKLADIKGRGYEELLREKIESELILLEKESLLKKNRSPIGRLSATSGL
jgi:hypothetical protein